MQRLLHRRLPTATYLTSKSCITHRCLCTHVVAHKPNPARGRASYPRPTPLRNSRLMGFRQSALRDGALNSSNSSNPIYFPLIARSARFPIVPIFACINLIVNFPRSSYKIARRFLLIFYLHVRLAIARVRDTAGIAQRAAGTGRSVDRYNVQVVP